MKKEKFNAKRHYYLYAKNHYKRSESIIKDLQKIQADYCECESEDVRPNDIILVLCNEVKKHIKYESQFLDFIEALHPERTWKVGYIHKDSNYFKKVINPHIKFPKQYNKPYDYNVAVISKFLSILCLTEVSNIDGKLGEPTTEILPLNSPEKYKKEK